MIKFCPKCETAHDPSRPCDPKGLKAVTARKTVVVSETHYLGNPEPITGVILNVPVNRLTELTALLTPDQQAVTKPAAEISRENPDRGAAASVSEPAMERFTKREDEVSARHDESMDSPHATDQSSQPSQSFERRAYQRLYMRAKPLAFAQGMSVGEYWRVTGYNWKEHIND